VQVLCDDDISIGAKRNLACSVAQGEIICHCDDDDWFSPDRLMKQSEPIRADKAHVVGLKMRLVLDIPSRRLMKCSAELHKRLFPHDVRCGTLMYRVQPFRETVWYPNVSRGEDAWFLHRLLIHGARLEAIDDPSCYVCVRHGDNVTPGFEYGPPEWEEVPVEQYLPQADIAFYTRCAQPPGASNVGKRFFSDVHSGVDFPEGASKR
jgi:glycosyltransferase involved in cell wall biosynthesis